MRGKGLPGYGKAGSTASKVAGRAKKVANSPAAKDLKKVAKSKTAKTAGAVAGGAAVLKKANDNMNKDLKRMEQLRKQYDKSAARNSMSFNEYVKKYGGR